MGDNFYLGDRNGVRTPMQWSPDRNAGFSKANPQQLYLPITIDPEYHYEAINVENQQKNLSSLLWWTRRVIAMRKNFKAFSRGSLEFLYPENPKVLAFLRRHEDETILVVVNLSRFSQAAEIDLSRFAGCSLMEVFSQNYFPPIKESPYPITLGPHAHYWFVLRASARGRARFAGTRCADARTPRRICRRFWRMVSARVSNERFCRNSFAHCRWFGAKARTIRELRIAEQVPISGEGSAHFWFLEVTYTDGAPETYALPVQIASGEVRACDRAGGAAGRDRPVCRCGGSDSPRRDLGCGFPRATFPRHHAASKLEGKIR